VRFEYVAISPAVAEKIVRKHNVTPSEVREAVESGRVYRFCRSRKGGYTYVVRGRTYDGRPLWVLVRPGRPGVAILITARHDDD
jgi:hypothetical protein